MPMFGLEVIAAVVLFALLAVATGMAIVGLLGAGGALALGTCPECHRLAVTTTTWRYCPYCAPGTLSRFAHSRALHPHLHVVHPHWPHWPHLHRRL